MWPEVNEVVIQMRHVAYLDLPPLNVMTFYLRLDYDNNCKPELTYTAREF